LFAKQNGGHFLLRLEDTDRERFVEEGIAQIVEAMEWLGLEPDEGFWISGGKHQNIEHIQSERHAQGFYRKYAEELIDKGLAYRDWTTSDELTQLRQKAQEQKKPFLFRRSMANTSGDEDKPHVIRFDINAVKKDKDAVAWEEVVRGKLQARYETLDDFIIIKSDGFPTYNFANVVDDNDMNITHVMRGDEFIPSTPKHLLIYEAHGVNPPRYVHLPVINGTDGKKLSKRTGDTNVLDYMHKGYPPEALLNFLALLGWNDGTEQEIYGVEELVKKFKLEQINTSPAIFDQKRLDWISGNHIRAMSSDELYDSVKEFWPEEAKDTDEEYKKKVLELVQERLKYYGELPDLTRFFFKDLPVNPELINNHKQLKKYDKDKLRDLLEQVRSELEKLDDFSAENIQQALNGLLERTGEKPVVLFSLIRIATTQAPASPGLAETLEVLSKDTCLKRIDRQIKSL
jgi:glutamyl-tRNA synthetase